MGVQISAWEEAILRGEGRPIVKYREYHPYLAAMPSVL